ncbi:MAG TPA: hypothetical protein P5316_20135, partial [Phycisphaerae bacterium]|nr:hypothetical protein [Phycisphaerae bacterium]
MTDAGRLLAGLLSFSAEEGLGTVLGSGCYVLRTLSAKDVDGVGRLGEVFGVERMTGNWPR